MNDITKFPRWTVVYSAPGETSEIATGWLEQGAAVESTLTELGWMHRLVEKSA